MADNLTVTVDGKRIEVPQGTLIIEAARLTGVEIPTFCYDERLKPVGACRMCLVEVEKMPKLIASCATPVAPDMIIHTESERVIKARTGVLEFLLINHPLDCPTCDKGGECPLQDNTYTYGPPVSRYKEDKIRFIEKDSREQFDEIALGPEILLCRNRCIMCFKCVRIVRDLAGEADLGVFQRGSSANINVLREVAFADEFSGNTVEYCPVGALTSRSFRYKIRDWLLKKAPSVCNLCSDGCNMYVEWSGGKVYRHMSRRNPEVDDGWLCDRGRYGFDISRSADRLGQPRIRRGNALEPCGWDEADALVARHLGKMIDENRTSEIGVAGSATLSNEEAYAIRRFFDNNLNITNIDFQTDTDRPVEPDLLKMMGLDGTIDSIQDDSLFLIVGCNPAVEHPVMSLRLRNVISRKKAKAVFIGSYDKRLGNFPVWNIRVPYAAEAMAIDYLASGVSGTRPVSANTGFSTSGLDSLIEVIRNSRGIHIIAGQGLLSHPYRRAFSSSLVRLRKAIGARLSILSPSGNFSGVFRFGLYGGVSHSFDQMLSRVNSGDINTMFLLGSNPVDEYPDRKYVQETLKKLDFLVVVNPFITPTVRLASIAYPQALPCDYGGSFTNIEGRVQEFEAMTERGEFESRPVWSLLKEISSLMGIDLPWHHHSLIRQEMARSLKGAEGLANIPDRGLMLPSASAAELDLEKVESVFSAPAPPADRPFVLQCVTSAHHPGWLTSNSENLMRIAGNQGVYMHPEDAVTLNIGDGNHVRIGTEDTALNLPVVISDRVNKGELLIENSFPENPVNRLLRRGEPITYVSVRKN
jgi:NADH-quinone oxidoreductase subunit G